MPLEGRDRSKHSQNKVHNQYQWPHSQRPLRYSFSLTSCCCSDPTVLVAPSGHLLGKCIAAADSSVGATADSAVDAADMGMMAASGDGEGVGIVGLHDGLDLSEGRRHTEGVVEPVDCGRGGGEGGTWS